MALTTQQLITQLYVGYYNRAPDPEGLNYWVARVAAGVSLADIADSFAASPEANAAYPWLGQANPSAVAVGAFLEAIYQNLFNRGIDADGLAFYSNELLTGLRTPGEIIASIQANANTNTNNTDGQILANKVAVGLAWAAAAEANPNFVYDEVSAQSAKTILVGVDATQASVDDAIATLEEFFATPRSLAEALDNLDAANEALDAAVEAAARADDLFPADGTPAAQKAFIDAYSAASAAAELAVANTDKNAAQTSLLTAQQALATARLTTSDAQLASNLAQELSLVADDAGAQTILQERVVANARLDADIAANGSNVELLQALRVAIGNYVAAGGDTTVEVDSGADTVADLLADLNAALAFSVPGQPDAGELAAVDALVATIGGYSGIAAPADDVEEALADVVQGVLDRAELIDAVTTADGNFAGYAGLNGVEAAELALETRQGLVDDVSDAQADFDAAQDYFELFADLVAAIEAAEAAVDAATDAFDLLGYEVPVVVAVGETATVGNDVFVVGDADGDIDLFGFLGNDVLSIGSGYTLVTLDDEDVAAGEIVGSASVLEVFVQQDGANTFLYIEQRAFDGNVNGGAFAGITIELTGVTAADLSFNDGFFTVA